jgi:hypothetical protein
VVSNDYSYFFLLQSQEYKPQLGAGVSRLLILATWEAEGRRIMVQGQPRQKIQEAPFSKVTGAKWTESVAEVVEHLSCKQEALSSKPSLKKKKNTGL